MAAALQTDVASGGLKVQQNHRRRLTGTSPLPHSCPAAWKRDPMVLLKTKDTPEVFGKMAR
jgi:hypothetical protein